MKRKTSLYLAVLVSVLLVCTIYACDRIIDRKATGKLYSKTANIPHNKVGLLLGVSKYIADSLPDPYYDYRINAAVALWKAGKIDYIIASGNFKSNSSTHQIYNEPGQMKSDLAKAGVDPACVFLDHAGFRTFDSMVRLKEIFGQTSVTIISQRFHNERALYIASLEGISAIGFNAQDAGWDAHTTVFREKLARVKVFLDYLLCKEPRFLGEKEFIP